MKTVLSIAGSDSSGGAGIQADIKTLSANGVYAMSVITSLTAQNTMGVIDIFELTPLFVEKQLDAVFKDIFPDAVKIGMVLSEEIILVIANKLREYKAKNIILDPVMVSTSGSRLLKENAIEALERELIPLAEIITPNIIEAEILANIKINDFKDIELAARVLSEKYKCAVLCKGGHNLNDANDFFYKANNYFWLKEKRIDNNNTHGTGCSLSSAIAANLAKNFILEESIRQAKKFISGALNSKLNLGHGRGPINHLFDLKSDFI